MKLKVCGMKMNTAEVAALQPDYLGFIFWEPSSRFFDGELPKLPQDIQKVGVFVDASVAEIIGKVKKYELQAVQLHGKENPEFCQQLRMAVNISNVGLSRPSRNEDSIKTSNATTDLKIIKVFSIKDRFDFKQLKPFEKCCDYYLFDTKGKLPGGNGYVFDWSLLKNYPSKKPYFLSGGIGLEDAVAVKEFRARPEAKYCYAIDVNSRFETEPGFKDVKNLNEFSKIFS